MTDAMSYPETPSGQRVRDVRFTDDNLIVDLLDGRVISVPLVWYPRLLSATPAQRTKWRLAGGGFGIHWPDVDEDLSTEGLLCGAPAVNVDLSELQRLNRDYIRSVQTSDVRRFDEILAEEFYCSNPDGSLVDRTAFLKQTVRPVTISNLEAHDVLIRVLGNVAIIHARTTYTLSDGRAGSGRYTDVWQRRDKRWLAVSAHVTRC